jgi:hypothetical protein
VGAPGREAPPAREAAVSAVFLRRLDPAVACCDFCGRKLAEAGGYLRGAIGGNPPVICTNCILAAGIEMTVAAAAEKRLSPTPAEPLSVFP